MSPYAYRKMPRKTVFVYGTPICRDGSAAGAAGDNMLQPWNDPWAVKTREDEYVIITSCGFVYKLDRVALFNLSLYPNLFPRYGRAERVG